MKRRVLSIRWRNPTLALALLAAALLLTIVLLRAGGGGDKTASAEPQFTEQSAAALFAGVEIRLQSATFSGSQTLLRLTISPQPGVVDESVATIAIHTGSLVLEGFSPGEAQFTPGRPEGVLQLPPPATGAGALAVEVRDLIVISQDGSRRWIRGSWALALSPPKGGLAGDSLATEDFPPRPVQLADGRSITIQATRSASETVVRYRLPGDLLPLDAPSLRTADGREFKGRPTYNGEDATVVFPATRPGDALELRIGPFAGREELTSPATVLLEVPIDPAPGAPAGSTLLVRANAGMAITRAVFGEDDVGRWVAFEVLGAWHPDLLQLTAADANVQPLALRDVGVSYALDAEGLSIPGTTRVALRFDERNDLGEVRLGVASAPRFIPATTYFSLN